MNRLAVLTSDLSSDAAQVSSDMSALLAHGSLHPLFEVARSCNRSVVFKCICILSLYYNASNFLRDVQGAGLSGEQLAHLQHSLRRVLDLPASSSLERRPVPETLSLLRGTSGRLTGARPQLIRYRLSPQLSKRDNNQTQSSPLHFSNHL